MYCYEMLHIPIRILRYNPDMPTARELSGSILYSYLQILLCITCIVSIIATELWSRIGWFTQLKRLCIISFMVSVAWNWMYLYKVSYKNGGAYVEHLISFNPFLAIKACRG